MKNLKLQIELSLIVLILVLLTISCFSKKGVQMHRTSRMLVSDEKAVYHAMSRTALDGFPLGDVEKEFMLGLIKRCSGLY